MYDTIMGSALSFDALLESVWGGDLGPGGRGGVGRPGEQGDARSFRSFWSLATLFHALAARGLDFLLFHLAFGCRHYRYALSDGK